MKENTLFMIKLDLSRRQSILIIIFLSIFILGTFLIFTVPFSVKSTYGLSTITDDGVTIAFNVFEPQNGGNNKPAFLIGHGSMVNKEMVKGYALELAAAGFVAVPFDFRGHGQSSSGGTNNMTKDVVAIREYLRSRGDVDMDSLGYIGYSMGGLGQALIEVDFSFKCFIGIGTWLDPSLRKGNSTNPLNVLMIEAIFDEAIDLPTLKESLSARTGLPTSSIYANKMYGSFYQGNASMIYLDDDSNHLKVAWDYNFIREARDWAITSFDLEVKDENFYVNIRAIILLIQVIGGVGFFFLIIEPLSKFILFSKEDIERKAKIEYFEINTSEISNRTIIIKSILFSLILALPGILIFFPILLILPLAVAAFVMALLYGQIFGLILLLWRIDKKVDYKFRDMFRNIFKEKGQIVRHLILGAVLSVVLYLIAYSSVGLNYLGLVPSVEKFWTIPIFFIMALLVLLIQNLLMQVIIQRKYKDTLKDILKVIFLGFLFPFLYFFVYLLILGFITRSFFYFGTFLPISIVMFLLTSAVCVVAYKKTGNILTGAIISAFLLTFLIVTMSPPQSGLAFLARFIH
ncbi:MAG: alpha/beta hydrolase [Candidatus Lokiarchaeota archaeon]|nr:alpha/beta hydrolase [Candidatus Lokiarchaeota archaeon]